MNDAQQKAFVTVVVFGGIPIAAISMATLIRLQATKETMVLLGLLAVLVPNSLMALLVLLGGMAELATESGNCTKQIRRSVEHWQHSKTERKHLYRSCSTLTTINVRFGSLNFIESVTPLKCIDYANQLTIQVLLLAQ